MYFQQTMTPSGALPVWTPRAWLILIYAKYRSFGSCGFREDSIHCFKQNINALGLEVSEKKSPIVCLWEPITHGWGHFLPGGA